GPAVRACAALPLSSRRTKCKGLKTRVITNKQAKTTAITFQPPPPRRGGGWVSLGGDGSNGGGVGGVGAFGGFIGGILLSIAGKRYCKPLSWASGILPRVRCAGAVDKIGGGARHLCRFRARSSSDLR